MGSVPRGSDRNKRGPLAHPNFSGRGSFSGFCGCGVSVWFGAGVFGGVCCVGRCGTPGVRCVRCLLPWSRRSGRNFRGSSTRLGCFVRFSRSHKNGWLTVESSQVSYSAPRARGDGPLARPGPDRRLVCSPRTRGWSHHGGWIWRPARLLPAHAGMVPEALQPQRCAIPAPRARGDGPCCPKTCRAAACCSPRTRGWSQRRILQRAHDVLLPAHAGMVPSWRVHCWSQYPAPRARGDGPGLRFTVYCWRVCSPRTRGWSRGIRGGEERKALLPAHAGMVPATSAGRRRWPSAPRARGDGPRGLTDSADDLDCSPRTRGWSPAGAGVDRRRALLPAHAGMGGPAARWRGGLGRCRSLSRRRCPRGSRAARGVSGCGRRPPRLHPCA
ncbi:hypothetical protein SAMN05421803_11916 [Nocardiopsis flavescens]|uniref:Uncharacterized protein n=1 Tax=Nocardiopsis flavescens TaxID=758803 RepID=A0A1M6S4D4_9ACTN|nr:hypothetical protein SAMN05421803_11916 [Nocardiopsis flavescens]